MLLNGTSVETIAAQAQARKRQTALSWCLDATSVKVKGRWTSLCRAVYRIGKTHDCLLSEHRDLAPARPFLRREIATNGVPDRVVIDKIVANLAKLQAVNLILRFTGTGRMIVS